MNEWVESLLSEKVSDLLLSWRVTSIITVHKKSGGFLSQDGEELQNGISIFNWNISCESATLHVYFAKQPGISNPMNGQLCLFMSLKFYQSPSVIHSKQKVGQSAYQILDIRALSFQGLTFPKFPHRNSHFIVLWYSIRIMLIDTREHGLLTGGHGLRCFQPLYI